MPTDRPTALAAVAAEVRASPTTTVLGPAAMFGLGVWLMAGTGQWWPWLLVALIGAGTVVVGLGSAAAGATGYAGPAWWRRVTGHYDVGDRRSSGA